jgi:hypothetical protein
MVHWIGLRENLQETMVFTINYLPSGVHLELFTLWLFNIAMENGPFIDGLPIDSMVIFNGYVK